MAGLSYTSKVPQNDIGIDNIAVVHGLRRLRQREWQPGFWGKHSETALWNRIWQLLRMRDINKWEVVQVKSHHDPMLQTSWFATWTANGNDAADREAKRCLRNMDGEVKALYARACKETASQRSRLARIFTLQGRLLQHNYKPPMEDREVSTRPSASPYEHVLSMQCPLTPRAAVPQQSSLMPERFTWVLRTFWFQQTWYECDVGYPLAELYFALVAITGWVAPVNVAGWNQADLPHRWRSKLLTVFVHEVDFPDLTFCRPYFWNQCTTFQFAVKSLLMEQSFPFQLLRRKSLAYMGVFLEVPSLPVIPQAFKKFREQFLAAVGSRSWKTIKNSVFAPLTDARWESPVQVSTPLDIWAAYYPLA